MPPRIRVSLQARTICLNSTSIARSRVVNSPAATPAAQTQTRSAAILSNLSDVRSSYGHLKRVGRGPSSGKGKTSGRGHKGQKQHGKVPRGFEGGQTPLIVVHGKRGFKNIHSLDFQTVPLGRIQSWVNQGRLDPTKPITPKELIQSNCVHGIRDGIKLLSSSNFHAHSIDETKTITQPLHIVVSRASKTAIAEVEKLGGKVETRYYTNFAMRQILKGRMHPMRSLRSNPEGVAPEVVNWSPFASATPSAPAAPLAEPALPEKQFAIRLPDPAGRKDLEYYRDPAHRGYLAYTLKEGYGPSLFFATPEEKKDRDAARAAKRENKSKAEAASNRMW